MRTANVLAKETKKYTSRDVMIANEGKKILTFTMACKILSHLQ